MKTSNAARIFAALSHETRLRVFRLLVETGKDGVAASDIAARLDIQPATLSFHLKELSNAKLVCPRQAGRFIYYAADFNTMDDIMTFLTENCCGGAACEVARADERRNSA